MFTVECMARRFTDAAAEAGAAIWRKTEEQCKRPALRELRPKALTGGIDVAGDSGKSGHKSGAMKDHSTAANGFPCGPATAGAPHLASDRFQRSIRRIFCAAIRAGVTN